MGLAHLPDPWRLGSGCLAELELLGSGRYASSQCQVSGNLVMPAHAANLRRGVAVIRKRQKHPYMQSYFC